MIRRKTADRRKRGLRYKISCSLWQQCAESLVTLSITES